MSLKHSRDQFDSGTDHHTPRALGAGLIPNQALLGSIPSRGAMERLACGEPTPSIAMGVRPDPDARPVRA